MSELDSQARANQMVKRKKWLLLRLSEPCTFEVTSFSASRPSSLSLFCGRFPNSLTFGSSFPPCFCILVLWWFHALFELLAIFYVHHCPSPVMQMDTLRHNCEIALSCLSALASTVWAPVVIRRKRHLVMRNRSAKIFTNKCLVCSKLHIELPVQDRTCKTASMPWAMWLVKFRNMPGKSIVSKAQVTWIIESDSNAILSMLSLACFSELIQLCTRTMCSAGSLACWLTSLTV